MNVEVIVMGGTAAGGSREILPHQEMKLSELSGVLAGLIVQAPDIVMMEVQIAIPTVTVVSEKEVKSDRARWNAFHLVTKRRPKPEFVAESQKRLGYNPAGYGWPAYISQREVNGEWHTSWYCYDNCD